MYVGNDHTLTIKSTGSTCFHNNVAPHKLLWLTSVLLNPRILSKLNLRATLMTVVYTAFASHPWSCQGQKAWIIAYVFPIVYKAALGSL